MHLLCDCVCVCVCVSLSQTHTLTPTHPQNVKMQMIWCGRGWIHLYFLPSLREVSLLVTRMIVSLGRDFLRTPTSLHLLYMYVPTYIQESVYVLCESGRSNTHAQLTLACYTSVVNPRRACAARVMVVVLCVFVSVSTNLLVAQLRDKLVILTGSVSFSLRN